MRVHLKVDDAWDFFEKNTERLEEEMVEIASESQTSADIYLTEDDDFPCIVVYKNDVEVQRECCLNKKDLENSLQKIYMKYLVPDNSEDEPSEEDEIDEEIRKREDEIYQAFANFINELTEDPASALEFCGGEDSIEHVVNHIIRYLAVDCGFRIRRPMYVLDDDLGEEVFTEYPYEEYEFSDDEMKKEE
jgi:hypothetical protein